MKDYMRFNKGNDTAVAMLFLCSQLLSYFLLPVTHFLFSLSSSSSSSSVDFTADWTPVGVLLPPTVCDLYYTL